MKCFHKDKICFKSLHKKHRLNFLMNAILNPKIFIRKRFRHHNFKINLNRILIFAKKKQNILLI